MGNCCGCSSKKKKKNKIVLLLVGLDNAGKSVAVKGLAGEPLDGTIPTVGLSVVHLEYKNYTVKVFDLGGGLNIRGIWHRYFVDAHGIIFVVDSSDYDRMDEARKVLQDLLSHGKITGKPVLLLANKQDRQDALDEIDIVDKLQLEPLVNVLQCPTLVETCAATASVNKSHMDRGIQKGYHWLLNYIIRDFNNLNTRVETDVRQQELEDREARLEKIERLKKLSEMNNKRDDDVIESYSDYDRKVNGHAIINQDSSFEEQKEIFYIHTNNCIDADVTSSSSKSNESFPQMYYDRVETDERPKSAVQLVKQQLELKCVHQRPNSGKSFVSNKTAPANLYGVRNLHSAKERRECLLDKGRSLKSAGDSVFILTNLPNTVMGDTQGDELHRELFQLNNFQRTQRLPPIKCKSTSNDDLGNNTFTNKSSISVIDIT